MIIHQPPDNTADAAVDDPWHHFCLAQASTHESLGSLLTVLLNLAVVFLMLKLSLTAIALPTLVAWNPELGYARICLGLVLARSISRVKASPTRPEGTNFAAIDAYVTEQMKNLGIPGMALGSVQDGQTAHLQGRFIRAGGDPADPLLFPQLSSTDFANPKIFPHSHSPVYSTG